MYVCVYIYIYIYMYTHTHVCSDHAARRAAHTVEAHAGDVVGLRVARSIYLSISPSLSLYIYIYTHNIPP